jgi:glycosyltransferase involved in cell wall biosynthesis
MNVVTYTPHGPIPDTRGFAPSLAAQYLARHLMVFRNVHVSGQERHPLRYETDPEHGSIWRLREGRVYRRLFRKITRLDPWPLHARLARLLRGMPVDLLHAHQLEFPINDFRRRLGRDLPIVLHVHAMRTFSDARGKADAYIAVSSYTRDAMIAKGFPAERVHVVYNGADTDLFSPASLPDLERLKLLFGFSGKRVIAYVGRKTELKGYFDFIDVLESLAAAHADVRGIAAGALPPGAERDPAYRACLEKAQRLIARGVLLDLPALPHRSLARIFQVADVLLFATRAEQHPMVLVEALACGCAVVTTRIAGIPETVGEDTAVLLPEGASSAELARATLEVLDHPGHHSAMRQRARALALSRYDWRQQSLQLERIYFSVLAARHHV